HNQDTAGPHARTVADAAAVLGALVGVDARDPATAASAGKSFTDYTQFLDANALHGARIGVARATFTGYSEKTDAVFEAALQVLRDAGAVLVDPADLPSAATLAGSPAELTILIYDFKRDMAAYLATRTGIASKSLADLIAFNRAHRKAELRFFQQELFELADSDPFTAQQYADALQTAQTLSRTQGIDGALAQFDVDAIVAPTASPAFTADLIDGDHFLGSSSQPAAVAGYPHITVPAGLALGMPVGLSFFSTAWSEPKLLALAYAFEQARGRRAVPTFQATLPLAQADRAKGGESGSAELLAELLEGSGTPVRSGFRLHSL
ncbi:MAG TPA: amidase family protein, partial [Thermoanaerobaculia bacterium]